MKLYFVSALLMSCFCFLMAGCDAPAPVAAKTAVGGPPAPPPPPASAANASPTGADSTPVSDPPAGDATSDAAPPLVFGAEGSASEGGASESTETERVKAEKGVGIKGRSLDEYEGPIVTPAKTYFTAKERIIFEIAVPHALALYEATEGQGPKTHEEFMEKIVEANKIELPMLAPGHKYVYDPETKVLMVERPKKK